MSNFAQELLQLRLRSGRSGSALARGANIDASYLSRLERGEREPPRKEIVDALARELALAPEEWDRLLVSAGHPPSALARLGPQDPTLMLVANILADDGIPAAERAELREIVALVARRWRPASPLAFPQQVPVGAVSA